MDALKFKMIDWDDRFLGTHLQGAIDTSFSEIVRVFGNPNAIGDSSKVDAEWLVEFEDGTIASIYNYKTGKAYNGKRGCSTEKIRDWHIGGSSIDAVLCVREVLAVAGVFL